MAPIRLAPEFVASIHWGNGDPRNGTIIQSYLVRAEQALLMIQGIRTGQASRHALNISRSVSVRLTHIWAIDFAHPITPMGDRHHRIATEKEQTVIVPLMRRGPIWSPNVAIPRARRPSGISERDDCFASMAIPLSGHPASSRRSTSGCATIAHPPSHCV